jgi:hypothetical protein
MVHQRMASICKVNAYVSRCSTEESDFTNIQIARYTHDFKFEYNVSEEHKAPKIFHFPNY